MNNGLPTRDVAALAIDPTTPTTLYAAAWGTMFKSTNSGGSWTAIDNGLGGAAFALAIDPATPTTVYAGTLGNGVFKSTDSGGSWTAMNSGLPANVYVLALAIDPLRATLYAGTDRGVFKSGTGAGSSWSEKNSGLPASPSVAALAIDPATPTTLYAALNGQNGGVYKSTNSGGSWTAMNSGLPGTPVALALAIDPVTPATLYAAAGSQNVGSESVYKSTNGGGSWTAISSGLTGADLTALAIPPASHATLYLGTYGAGVFKSTNSGGSWASMNSGLPRHGYVGALAIDPGALYAMGTNGGGFAGVAKSTDRGGSWTAASSGLPSADQFVLAIDPVTPATLYAGACCGAGGSVFKTTNGGGSWTAMNSGLPSNVDVLAFAIDPVVSATLYAGLTGGVYKSTNGGGSWTAMNSGLPRTLSVLALAIDPATPATLYAGTDSGVYKSTDGGGSWTAANNGLPSARSVFAPAIDPTTPATLYAIVVGAGVYKSTNSGGSWTAINNGLPSYVDVGALAIDPVMPATLYAGTIGAGLFEITQIVPICGNGIVDLGEPCDGGPSGSANCCTPTCTLVDDDSDGVCNAVDNCLTTPNPDQRNSDAQQEPNPKSGDMCDDCPNDPNVGGCVANKTAKAIVDSTGSRTCHMGANSGATCALASECLGGSCHSLTTQDGSIVIDVPSNALPGPTSVSITGYNGASGVQHCFGGTNEGAICQIVAQCPSGTCAHNYALGTNSTVFAADLQPERKCQGGANDGAACTVASECPGNGGSCVASAFDAPVTLTFTWLDEESPATQPGCTKGDRRVDGTGISEGNLKISRNGVAGVACKTVPAECDQCNNKWTIQVTQFSEYALLGSCTAALSGAKLTLAKVLPPGGDDKLSFKGTFIRDTPIGDIDPLAHGLELAIDDDSGNVLHVALAAGVFDAGAMMGWKVNASGTKWTYRNGTLAPPGGIVNAIVQDVDDGSSTVKFAFRGKAGDYPVNTATASVHAEVALPGAAECVEARFPGPAPAPSCAFNRSFTTIKCK
jgi:photosystem II stability/assembly factor-like uncharacterized protein